MQQQLRDNHRRTVNAEQVPGWGVDADPKNDPTYPIKTHVAGEHDGYKPQHPDRPDQQAETVEVLHSNERPNLPAVYGTTVPPSGLSGMIRRAAFSFSENSYGHWMPLMLADRVQMVEGVVDDLAHGHIPNIFSELGWKAEWKHDRKAVITKVAVGTALAVGIYALLRSRRNRSDERDSTNGLNDAGSERDAQSGGPMANRSSLGAIRAEQTDMMRERLGTNPALSTGSANSTPGVATEPAKIGQPVRKDQPSGDHQSSRKIEQSMGDQESEVKKGGLGASGKTGQQGI